MGVVCAVCGKISEDLEFCDHCNTDLRGPAADPVPPERCPVSKKGVLLTLEQRQLLVRPEASILVADEETAWRAHWIARAVWPRWLGGVRERLGLPALTCWPPCRLVEEEEGAWVLAETTNQAAAPWTERAADPYEDAQRLARFFRQLADALEELHSQGLVWLTFDPRHLEQGPGGWLRFTNLDICAYQRGECPERLPLRPGFAAPEVVRFQAGDIGPRTDVFHLALFAYYWLAGLLPDGFPGEGLESFGFQVPPLRTYAPAAPVGIIGVLEQGMALEPTRRYATPGAIAFALREAVERAEGRRTFAGKLTWNIGVHTRAGRPKSALGKANEDHVLVCPFTGPDRALMAVADGITICDVGSGALASLIVTIVLENTFDAGSNQETFPERIAQACQKGASTLLDWALEKGYQQQLTQGADLMGTTLCAGWLEGSTLSLANVGDSRAYLIDRHGVEQLTVDGDLASGMLATGTPPEQIRELGLVGKALRECIGGCTLTPDGDAMVLEAGCNPALTRWPLLPGDIVILCSDGLVEEEAFMEPETLGELVRTHRHLPAAELALFLADQADALQRLPSPQEPEGYGDNISCIVIKMEMAPTPPTPPS